MVVMFHEKCHFFHRLQWDTQVKPVNNKVSVCEVVLEQVYALLLHAVTWGEKDRHQLAAHINNNLEDLCC